MCRDKRKGQAETIQIIWIMNKIQIPISVHLLQNSLGREMNEWIANEATARALQGQTGTAGPYLLNVWDVLWIRKYIYMSHSTELWNNERTRRFWVIQNKLTKFRKSANQINHLANSLNADKTDCCMRKALSFLILSAPHFHNCTASKTPSRLFYYSQGQLSVSFLGLDISQTILKKQQQCCFWFLNFADCKW